MRMRVLIAEDDPLLCDGLARALRAAGHSVDVASDGEGADRCALAGAYDLLVLDVGLPGIDGFEVLRRLRARGDPTRVIILTARDAVADRVHGLDLGADDYLTKPFSYAELLARLRALGRRGAVERPTRLVVGDLTLDPAARRVWRGDAEIALSAKEFALLAFLAQNRGRVFSRETLLARVWGARYEGGARTVDIHVRRLRMKLGDAFPLETLRGAGYKLPSPAGPPVKEGSTPLVEGARRHGR